MKKWPNLCYPLLEQELVGLVDPHVVLLEVPQPGSDYAGVSCCGSCPVSCLRRISCSCGAAGLSRKRDPASEGPAQGVGGGLPVLPVPDSQDSTGL